MFDLPLHATPWAAYQDRPLGFFGPPPMGVRVECNFFGFFFLFEEVFARLAQIAFGGDTDGGPLTIFPFGRTPVNNAQPVISQGLEQRVGIPVLALGAGKLVGVLDRLRHPLGEINGFAFGQGLEDVHPLEDGNHLGLRLVALCVTRQVLEAKLWDLAPLYDECLKAGRPVPVPKRVGRPDGRHQKGIPCQSLI